MYRRPEAGVYEHNGNCSAAAIMLVYCVFNASSAAVSLYQPLTVKFLKNTGLGSPMPIATV